MKQNIEDLINFEINNGVISRRDYNYVKNQIYSLLELENNNIMLTPQSITSPSDALDPILNELETKHVLDGSQIARDLFDAKIMNVFTMLPSNIENHYHALLKQHPKNPRKATDWLYDYAKNVNYIREDRVLKNKSFSVDTRYGPLQITVNLSKPEKDPKSIALAAKNPANSYPTCVLCPQNEGFSGNASRDSRNQMRLLEITLNKEKWFFQYSPYIYYNEHAIVLSNLHRPMEISNTTFSNLFSLLDQFEGYFFGSNADLPIVGGSILSHDHYQGGRHSFPIENAKIIKEWVFQQTCIQALDWPLSTIRLIGKNTNELRKIANLVLLVWSNYSDEKLGLSSHTNGERHHTITPIARKDKNVYTLDLVLRDNQTNEQYPLGIFHPHEDKWHIKKENIGLIEVMGLAILPARLETELASIKGHILHNVPITENIQKHVHWINELKKKHVFNEENIDTILEQEIGRVFAEVLEDCGVYKSSNSLEFTKFVEEEIYDKLINKRI